MSFAIYIVGFLILIIGLAWGLTTAGVPPLYVGIGALIMLGVGVITGVTHTRSKDRAE